LSVGEILGISPRSSPGKILKKSLPKEVDLSYPVILKILGLLLTLLIGVGKYIIPGDH